MDCGGEFLISRPSDRSNGVANISHHSWKQSEFGATAGGGFGELPGLHTNNKFLDSLVNQLECVISVEHIRSLFDSQNHLYGDLEDIASSIGVSE